MTNTQHLSIHALLHLSTQSDDLSHYCLPFINLKTFAIDDCWDLKQLSQSIALGVTIMGALHLTGRGS